MKDIELYKNTVFDSIKHIDEEGHEFWYARELQTILEYKRWQKFMNVINNAKVSCEQSKFIVDEQFTQVGKLSKRNNNAIVKIEDYKLSRYACYLIVQNSGPRKEVVALGQTYFAI